MPNFLDLDEYELIIDEAQDSRFTNVLDNPYAAAEEPSIDYLSDYLPEAPDYPVDASFDSLNPGFVLTPVVSAAKAKEITDTVDMATLVAALYIETGYDQPQQPQHTEVQHASYQPEVFRQDPGEIWDQLNVPETRPAVDSARFAPRWPKKVI